jgi:polar amino acid transport system substrate-binding protein
VETPVATTEPTVPTTNAWERIQESGQIVVGTSADYAPFEYYTDEFALDGFDMALIQAIVQEMGYNIVVRDLAFDGLGDALQLGQIDIAISAISYTSERDAVIDFSNVYYISEAAVLASADSGIGPITSAEQVSGYTVGVQSGTVFQRWLQEGLVDTGLLPEESLFVYQNIDDAIADLTEGRIDLVMLDAIPAETAVNDPDLNVAIVASELDRQRYAIAMANGEAELQMALNKALAAVQATGYITQLSQTYLGLAESELPELPETVPPTDLVPPIVPEGCIDGMMYIQDLNYDDNGMQNPIVFAPDTPFTKGWRIQNIGTCTWDSSYALVPVGGNIPGAEMSGRPTPIQGSVPPGSTYDVFVDLVAPSRPGVYQGFWAMRNGQNEVFGARIWVGIEVVVATTPTPIPTQPPSADIQFWSDTTQIKQGECTTLYWDVNNVQAVYLYELGQNWQDHGVNGEGSRRVCPSQTTTYELRVVKPDGSVEVRQITVYVEQVSNAPIVEIFSVSPTQIGLGQCVQIQWKVSGNVSSVDIRRDSTAIWDSAPLNGVMQDCPPNPGSVNYTITATGSGGTAYQEQRVNVTQ